MNPNQYFTQFLYIEQKFSQALRVNKKLENKRAAPIFILHSAEDTGKVLQNLEFLAEVYKRRIRVLDICEKGLDDAKKVFQEAEGLIASSESLSVRIKSRIPLLIGGNDNEQILLWIITSICRDLRNEITYLRENFVKIRRSVQAQYDLVRQIIKNVEEGILVGNISKTPYFEKLESLRNEELELIRRRKGKSGAERVKEILQPLKEFLGRAHKIADRNTVMKSILDTIKKNPRLAAIYAPILPMPTLTTGRMIGTYIMGPVGYPIFWGITFALEFGPMAAYIIHQKIRG